MFQTPLYRYAFTAHVGRVAQPVRETWIGEVEARDPRGAAARIRRDLRALCGFYPREVKLGAGQFSRMRPRPLSP